MASQGYSQEDRFQPSAKLLKKTAAAGFSYLGSPNHHPQQQQRLPVARSISHGDGYNSLPRQRPKNAGPTSLSDARRKMVNSAVQDYLKSLNAMTRSIVLETETVEKENKCEWTQLDVAKKEDLVNDHFMPVDVRKQYNAERAASCCSFASGVCYNQQDLPLQCSREDLVMENRQLHSSQSSDWEQHGQKSRSSHDLVYTNEWSANGNHREELSLSQPSLANSYPEETDIAENTNFNRLHKKQLSFRPGHKHAVKQTRPPPQHSAFRKQLGSDGESPQTSDEDYEGSRLGGANLLGFQRTKLRSLSMRSKRANGNQLVHNSANLRSSVRNTNRISRTTPEREDSALLAQHADPTSSYNTHCRPSHSHTYSTTSTETDFDEAIDMPDDALLLDHISRKSSTEEEPIIIISDSSKNNNYIQSQQQQKTGNKYSSSSTSSSSRARRSFRNTPKITLEQQGEMHSLQCTAVQMHSLQCSEATRSNSSFSTTESYLQDADVSCSTPSRDDYRPPSRESLDLDSISMAPSEASKYPMDDEESMIDSRMMTPDSILSTSSSFSCRPRSKNGEMAVLRNCMGKRGGSHIKVSTSEFAERHTQFKNSTGPKSHSSGDILSRATSPASSIASSVAPHWPAHLQDSSGHLKAPGSFKRDSTTDSAISDFPCSPDRTSFLSSPPSTPLAVSYTANSHLLRKMSSSAHHEDRESGYMSSSSESFPVASRR